MDGFTLGTYDDTELGSLEGSTEGIIEVDFEGLLLDDWLGSVIALVIGFNKVIVLSSWYGKVIGTTLGALVGLLLDDKLDLIEAEIIWNYFDSLHLGDNKAVCPLLDIFMGLEMMWRWRFLVYSYETILCTNGYSFVNNFLKIHPKIHQLQM